MRFSEYASYDGLGLAKLIAGGEVTPREVADCAFSAIAEKNPALNAVLATLDDQPYENDRAFSGVPFLVKELILHAAGAPCRAGSRALPSVPMEADTNPMRRFRAPGLHLAGTPPTPQAGYNATTDTVAFGPVHNPWRTGHSEGGSTGGPAAAAAPGLVRTAHANAPWVRALTGKRPVRLSRAALECIAIVAYKQPATRSEVEDVRGVDSSVVLRSLLEKDLLRIVGRKDEPGRPMLYGTTRRFQEVFGLRKLSDLPSLREFAELAVGEQEGLFDDRTLEDGGSIAATTDPEPPGETPDTE